ncbi:related to YIA6-Pvruvate transporter of the mitochondrial inner membrane [Sporisorium scitamineum]|uniref:Related to YIA6-Pvruvate transporter of the mitochondrial inner membrane n=1 Tax=Sporisorium scitamineum TaxID=49012 RepID=A0A140KM21_9BASI|nr:related to YIA6-Pvruvate transporter of the mitochondrial inner membrane [Sporisorium scitamineum]
MLHSSAIAGACAGLVSSVVTCPLDVVKTRLQAQEGCRRPIPPNALSSPAPIPNAGEPPRYLGLTATLRKIWHDDGFRGFYRGLGPTIFGYLPTWAIYFTVYDSCKSAPANHNLTASEDFLNHIVSAMTAGAASTVCTSPLWVVKTRFMLQSVKDTSAKPYRHTGDAFVQIYKSEGLRGFYKGLLPSLFGVSHVAVQFPLYESFKSLARRREGEEEAELEASTILLCSSTAKMIASVTTYPHEVLRTRLQMQPRNKSIPPSPTATPSSSISSAAAASSSASTPPPPPTTAAASADPARVTSTGSGGRYTGVIQACRTIAREEGIRGFYKGMTVNLVRTVPSSALTILTYELIMQHLTHVESSQQHQHRHRHQHQQQQR